MTVIAHVAGVPLEELALPLLAGGGPLLLAARETLRRLTHRNREGDRP